MDFVIIAVRLGKLFLLKEQMIEPLSLTKLEVLVHLDRLERADFDANLAAHADGNVDVESCRIKLRLPDVVRFLIFALNYIDALRRTFLLADLASHAAQPGVRIVAVKNQEGKVAIIFGKRDTFFRILDRDEALFFEIASREIAKGNRHPF